MLGQGIEPGGYDPLVDSLPLEDVRRFVQHIENIVGKTAHAMPLHQTFIDQHCRARDTQPASVDPMTAAESLSSAATVQGPARPSDPARPAPDARGSPLV